jgi:hypothetical protein
MIQSAVHQNPIEPCPQVGPAFEEIEMDKRMKQTVLDDVFRILFIAGHPKGEVVHISPMTLNERQERLHVRVIHFSGSRPPAH